MNIILVALVTAAVFGAGFTSGWQVNGWRLGTQIERLSGENKTLLAANEKCGVDVAAVRKAVKEVTDASLAATKRAQQAMEKAAKTSAGHLGRAERILNQPTVPLAEQCAAIQREQAEYVQGRRK